MTQFSALIAFVALLPAVMGQVQVWGQCGGIGYQGSTTCASGSGCVKVNDYYSQCQPGATAAPPPSTTAAPPTTTNVPPPATTDSTTPTATTGPSPTNQACSPASSPVSGYTNSKLPDPFLFADGKTRVTTKADWTCRAQEIISLAKGYESGALPGKPASVTGSISGSSLTVSVSDGGKSVSFSSTITYPSGTAPAAGWPVVIAYGGASLPIAPGIATLNYDNGNVGAQDGSGSRGKGVFYNLYGSGHTASAMTAWAWGVSRIIDALETTPSAKLNPKRVGVTGCSRNGKGAFMAGVLEPRIALTMPQESGAGGDTCWRLTAYENQNGGAAQPATQIVGENPWFSKNFENYVTNLNALPYDHHSLAATIAPRALLSYENTDYKWLSPMSGWGCVSAAHTVYQALGVPQNHGYIQDAGHGHCSFPSNQQASAFAFQNKFLRDQDVSTNYFTTNNQFGGPTFTPANWITWTTPTLT